jgi:AraC-like DNA-binding protein
VALLQNFLLARWPHCRPDADRPGHDLQDWVRSLTLRAAHTGLGRSLRQVERRIKHWTGLPMRELRGLTRAEQAFFDAKAAQADGAVNWADVAHHQGFADQAHLCRVTRRITGFSPEELRRRIEHDETFWVYRIWS